MLGQHYFSPIKLTTNFTARPDTGKKEVSHYSGTFLALITVDLSLYLLTTLVHQTTPSATVTSCKISLAKNRLSPSSTWGFAIDVTWPRSPKKQASKKEWLRTNWSRSIKFYFPEGTNRTTRSSKRTGSLLLNRNAGMENKLVALEDLILVSTRSHLGGF